MTIKSVDKSREVRKGLPYSKFDNLIKIPFDIAKQYPFRNRRLAKMPLDPSYLVDCESAARGNDGNQPSLKSAY